MKTLLTKSMFNVNIRSYATDTLSAVLLSAPKGYSWNLHEQDYEFNKKNIINS